MGQSDARQPRHRITTRLPRRLDGMTVTRFQSPVRRDRGKQTCSIGRRWWPTGRDQRPFANDLAIWRAHSMNRIASGLSVRFFSVTIPIGRGDAGNLTGKTRSERCAY